MKRIAVYDMPRKKAVALALVVGVGLGVVNTAFRVEFIPLADLVAACAEDAGALRRAMPYLKLAGKIVGALAAVIVLHEGVHGLTAMLFRYRPRFGLKPPLVYVTFDMKVPRGVFMAVALAPLVVLDAAFACSALGGVLPVFSRLCLMVNTVGAVGDAWIVSKLARHARGTLVQDTKTGIEVWEREAPHAAGQKQ